MSGTERFRTVIFDLDGTLLDTLRDLGDACNWTLERRGWPTHDTWAYRYFVGNGTEKLLRRAAPPEVPDSVLKEQVLPEYRAYYNAHSLDSTCPYLGLPRVLDALRGAGVHLAVLTNKFQNNAEDVIRRYYPGVFAAVRGGGPGVPYKPDPTALLGLMAQLGAEAESTLFVGDSGVDIRTAKNAGLASCGVLWGFRERQELAAEGADYIIRSPLELAQIVLGDVDHGRNDQSSDRA